MQNVSLTIDGFTAFVKPAIKLSHLGRASGGVAVVVKNKLNGVIESIDVEFDNIVLLKLSANYSTGLKMSFYCAVIFGRSTPHTTMTKRVNVHCNRLKTVSCW
jgi:hypothetical protein